MGFPNFCYSFPKTFVVLICLFDSLRFAFWLAVFSICQKFVSSEDQINLSSSPYVFIPPSSIKRRLPVIEFRNFSQRSKTIEEEEEEAQCAVCLEALEAEQEIRELGNCCHAFHIHCVDEWIDIGQVTCPLCRVDLLPNGIEEMPLKS